MLVKSQPNPDIVVSRQTGEWFRIYAELSHRRIPDLVELALREWIAARIRDWLEVNP